MKLQGAVFRDRWDVSSKGSLGVQESIADLAGNKEKSIMTIYIIFEVIVTVCRQVSEVHLVNPEHVAPLIRL